MPPPTIDVAVETFPVAGRFTISRGSRTEATVVVATVRDGPTTGRGECVPYPRYGESIDSVVAAIRSAQGVLNRRDLQARLPPGAARNALDCAFWDLESKAAGRAVAELTGLPVASHAMATCFTLSLDAPDVMAAAAVARLTMPLLKLKLGGDGDEDRMRAVRAARPDARLVADANEAWPERDVERLLAVAAACRLELIEQPLPADADAMLAAIPHPVPICADESVKTPRDLAHIGARYDAVNIKLDKTGGLTEAITMARDARQRGLRIMVGCMLSTSLSMAPALLLGPLAEWLDLDGPLLLARDRTPSMTYVDGSIAPPPPGLWG